MILEEFPHSGRRAAGAGFTIIEALFAIGIIGIIVVALYSGMTSSVFTIRLARENLRATDIMVEKAETIRLFTWEQLTNSAYVPTSFTNYYYDSGETNGTGTGITYNGTVSITPVPNANRNYSNDLRAIAVSINWSSGGVARTRSFTTYVGRYGIQNYLIN